MNYFQKRAIFSKFTVILFALSIVFPATSIQAASTNLIKNPSFETDVDKYWDTWSNSISTRVFTMTRSDDVPYGYGSYSAVINATGNPANRFDNGIITNELNPISLTSGKTYIFSFYAKTVNRAALSVYLANGTTFEAVTDPQEILVSNEWKRYQVSLTPTYTGNGALSFAFGDLSSSTSLNLDGLDLFENNTTFTTQTVVGFIGDRNKTLNLANSNHYTVDDVKIELPYFNEQTGRIETKQFAPTSLGNNKVTFDMPTQTFGGVGKVYLLGSVIGQFNYNVKMKITEFAPNPVRADEDLVVYGTGFNPNNEQTFILVKAVGANGALYDLWIKPYRIDSGLSQAVVKLPIGQVSVKTYFTNIDGTVIENKSAALTYNIKPSIYNVSWSRPGYEQVGDKISIYGKGISKQPTVIFYDENDTIIFRKSAVLKTINTVENYEVIEVATPVTLNKVKITVKVGTIESDKAEALSLTAKPLINSITAKNKRVITQTNTSIPAAKPGETIRILGRGFKTTLGANVEFNTVNGRSIVPVGASQIDPNGNWVEVVVPTMALSGNVTVEINGKKSNSASLEIIPVIVSYLPLNTYPGTNLNIWTQGVGLDLSAATVYFKLTNNEEVAVKPSALVKDNNAVIMTVLVPKSVSSNGSTVQIQYGNWSNDESYKVIAAPHIDSASIDAETKILSIKGHGFATALKNNKITYMYADHTVVTPKVKMISIQNTNEGQEIKIQILDNYSYGFITLTSGEQTSNEVSVGPAMITRIERRMEFVKSERRVMGVLYISGKNFGTTGGVKVGRVWATTHYRSNVFIIAVVEPGDLRNNPVIVTKK
jgi:hypothetical protein